MEVRSDRNHRVTHLVALKLFICLLLLFHFVKHITIYLNRVQDKHTVLRGASSRHSSECADRLVMLACGYAPQAGGMFGLSSIQKCLSSALFSMSATTHPPGLPL